MARRQTPQGSVNLRPTAEMPSPGALVNASDSALPRPLAPSAREHSLFLRLGRAYHLASQAFEVHTGMTGARWRLIYLIGRQPGCTAKWLIESTRVDPASITRQISSLVRAGWLRRWPDSADRRVTRLALTAAGEAKALEVTTLRARFIEQLCREIEPHALEASLQVLDRVAINLGAPPATD